MRRWTAAEIRTVVALHKRGLRQVDIARSVNRPPGSVGNLIARLARLGRLHFRQPAFGHPRARGAPSPRLPSLALLWHFIFWLSVPSYTHADGKRFHAAS